MLPSGDTKLVADTIIGVLVSKDDISKIVELCGAEQKELRVRRIARDERFVKRGARRVKGNAARSKRR